MVGGEPESGESVIRIVLTPEEAATLRDILTGHLRNLRRERADTVTGAISVGCS
jgi:hypothetical protein